MKPGADNVRTFHSSRSYTVASISLWWKNLE